MVKLTEYPHISFQKDWQMSEQANFQLGQCESMINRDREALAGFPSHTTRHTGPYQGGSVWLNVHCVNKHGKAIEVKYLLLRAIWTPGE